MGKTFDNKMGNQVIIENYGKWVLNSYLISGRGSNMKNILKLVRIKN